MKSVALMGASLLAFVGILGAPWPIITPVATSFDVDLGKELISIDMPLTSADRREHYLFWCRGGSTKTLDEMSDREGINYVGPLMCVLNEGNVRNEGSLLAEDDVGPWHTRGMFHREELVGACGAYPEFGRDRSFRLRGMVLRLKVTDVRLGNDGLPQTFRLVVSVTPDPHATHPEAERPGYLAPNGDCGVVRKGRETRMCRNWTKGGSYAPCPR